MFILYYIYDTPVYILFIKLLNIMALYVGADGIEKQVLEDIFYVVSFKMKRK